LAPHSLYVLQGRYCPRDDSSHHLQGTGHIMSTALQTAQLVTFSDVIEIT